mmetsp:Transcript_25567/g.82450  ORF Transcript_25567/g.82450 Transcript_25567/m.82450 type:complete len:173 (-) Transcript_25567:313-831(-)
MEMASASDGRGSFDPSHQAPGVGTMSAGGTLPATRRTSQGVADAIEYAADARSKAETDIGRLKCTHALPCAVASDVRWSRARRGSQCRIAVQDVESMEVEERYLICFHWSVSMIAGELSTQPVNKNELVFAVLALFLGIIGISRPLAARVQQKAQHAQLEQEKNLSEHSMSC